MERLAVRRAASYGCAALDCGHRDPLDHERRWGLADAPVDRQVARDHLAAHGLVAAFPRTYTKVHSLNARATACGWGVTS